MIYERELTHEQMRKRYPDLGPKMRMVQLGDAMYAKDGDLWYLLDPERYEQNLAVRPLNEALPAMARKSVWDDTPEAAVRQEAREEVARGDWGPADGES